MQICELKQRNVSLDTLCLVLFNGPIIRVAARGTKKVKKKAQLLSGQKRSRFLCVTLGF